MELSFIFVKHSSLFFSFHQPVLESPVVELRHIAVVEVLYNFQSDHFQVSHLLIYYPSEVKIHSLLLTY